MGRKPHIIAKIKVLLSNPFGRDEAVNLGGRVSCGFLYRGELFDCLVSLQDGGVIELGDEVEIPLSFLHPDVVRKRIKENGAFELIHNRKVIGKGQIVSIPDW